MATWTTIDWNPGDPDASETALGLLRTLEAAEGDLAPLLPAEFADELGPGCAARFWYAGDELLGFGLLRPDGVFHAVLLPEQREMSLFLPMLAWAESTRRSRFPDATLQVVAQDDDVCLPFLLLRLDFTAAATGWSRRGTHDAGMTDATRDSWVEPGPTITPDVGVFRLYTGGQVGSAAD